MMKKLQRNQGFTLVELTIAIALYSFLLLIVLGGFLGVFWIFNKVNISNKVQQDGRASIDVITRATRFADSARVETSQVNTNTKAFCISGADGRIMFFRAKTSTQKYAIYQKNSDTCSIPNPEDIPANEVSLQRLTTNSVNVAKFNPTMLDNNSSVELKVDISSGLDVTPTTAIDRFESYVSFQTVVNVRSYRGQ